MSTIGRGSTAIQMYWHMDEYLYDEIMRDVRVSLKTLVEKPASERCKIKFDTLEWIGRKDPGTLSIDSLGLSGLCFVNFKHYMSDTYVNAIKYIKLIEGILYLNIPRCRDYRNLTR